MTEPSKAVFLSYASQDAEAARRICEALRAGGIEVWFDQSELRGGDVWDQKIRREIHDCSLFIPIISANTASRREGYFRLEWDLADQRTHMMARDRAFIVPVSIDATPASGTDVPESFVRAQSSRLAGGETPPAFVQRISHLLSPAQTHATAYPRSSAAPTPGHPSNPALLLIAAVVVLGVGYLALDRIVLSKRQAADVHTLTHPASTAVPAVIVEKSIAVLPFVDMSEKRDQEYFSDGLSEELIALLTKVPNLRVPARTSSFFFKGKSEDIATIAEKLHVANVLEGSVRKSGNTLRVTAQLIRADNGYHLWSETYDRELKDVFKVQDDIAGAVVKQLQLKILGAVPTANAATANTEAYNLYLQGRYFTGRETPADLNKAIERYQQALELDPGYAGAWAWLAYTYVRRQLNSSGAVGEGFTKARAAAERAIELGPTLADGYVVLANIQWAFDFNWAAAAESLAKARQIDPNNALAIEMTGHLSRATASPEETTALFRRSIELDPMNLTARKYLGRVLYYAGLNDEAEATLRQVLDLNPDFQGARYELGRVLIARGQPAAALSSIETEKSAWRDLGLPLGYRAAGENAKATAALATLVANPAGREFQIAEAYAFFGDADDAFAWLDKARQMHDAGVIWLRSDPLLTRLRDDPRYKAFLHNMKLPR